PALYESGLNSTDEYLSNRRSLRLPSPQRRRLEIVKPPTRRGDLCTKKMAEMISTLSCYRDCATSAGVEFSPRLVSRERRQPNLPLQSARHRTETYHPEVEGGPAI